jgi:hypothetical protein
MFWQTIGAVLGIVIAALLFPDAPSPIFIGAAFFGGWGMAWLAARIRYGRGVIVTPSRRVD